MYFLHLDTKFLKSMDILPVTEINSAYGVMNHGYKILEACGPFS